MPENRTYIFRSYLFNIKHFISIAVLLSVILSCMPFFSHAQGTYTGREERIRENISDILSSPEFSQPKDDPGLFESIAKMIGDIYKRVKDFVLDTVKRILKPAFPFLFGEKASTGAAVGMFILGILIVILFFAVLLYFILRNLRRSKAMKQREDALVLSTLKDPSTVEQMAVEYCRNGDYTQGIRFLYMALLLKLNALDVIKIDRAKTNKQYVKEVMNSGFPLQNLVADFTRVFNECWYGGRKTDGAMFSHWHSMYTLLTKGGSA